VQLRLISLKAANELCGPVIRRICTLKRSISVQMQNPVHWTWENHINFNQKGEKK